MHSPIQHRSQRLLNNTSGNIRSNGSGFTGDGRPGLRAKRGSIDRRRGVISMAKIGKVADWLGVSAPLLDEEITEVASIETAGPGSVVFAVDKDAMTRALASKAGAILANRTLEVA